MKFADFLKAGLRQQQKEGRYRRRRVVETAQDVRLRIAGRTLLNFCSNDYLGFASHPRLQRRMQQAISRYGCGSGASHLICGHQNAHHQLEEELADYLDYPACLLFSSGYHANIAVIQCLTRRQDVIFADKLNHASLIDAAQLSRASVSRYAHRDYQQLQRLLANAAKQAWLVSDAVFSMDGDIADVERLVQLKQQYSAWLMLDDAHGFGVLGKGGRGTLEKLQIASNQVEVYMATLGKAMGVSGAFVAGSKDLIEYLLQFARAYTYTTAMPAVLAETLRESLLLLQQEAWRREKLQALIQYFRKMAAQAGIVLEESTTAIQPLIAGSNEKALFLSSYLFQQGILVSAIRPPTVPANTARLRITLTANHNEADLEFLLEQLSCALKSYEKNPTG